MQRGLRVCVLIVCSNDVIFSNATKKKQGQSVIFAALLSCFYLRSCADQFPFIDWPLSSASSTSHYSQMVPHSVHISFSPPASLFYWKRDMCWLNGSQCSVHSIQHSNIIIMIPGGVKIASVIFTNKGFFQWIISAFRTFAPTKNDSSNLASNHLTRLPPTSDDEAEWDRTLISFFIPLHFFFTFTRSWCEYKLLSLIFCSAGVFVSFLSVLFSACPIFCGSLRLNNENCL